MNNHFNENDSVSEDEEGEIKDNDNTKISNDDDGFSNIYIDNLINGKHNFFEDLLNFDCSSEINENLNDIDANDLLRTEEIRDRFEFRNNHKIINSDTESDEDTESAEEIVIPQLGSILDSLLDSKTRLKKGISEKTKKGRIVDKDSELEYMIPSDLERRLSNIVVSVSDEMKLIGTIIHSIEGTQAVTMKTHTAEPILDLETVVFDKNKRMIGVIDNIFGTKKQPNYLIICKDLKIWSSLRGGEDVFCAPSIKNAYFTTVEAHELHQDDDSELVFSDDEKEEQHRRQLAGLPLLTRKPNNSRKRKPSNANRLQHPRQTQRPNQRMMNPFRVSEQPFGCHISAPSYWSGVSSNPILPNMTMPPPMLNNQAGPPAGMPYFMSYPPPPTSPFFPMDSNMYQFQQQQHQYRPQFPPRSGGR